MFKESPKDRAQWIMVDNEQIPFVAILAPKELAAGTCRIKAQVGKDAAGDNKGEEVKLDDVVDYLKARLAEQQ